LGEDHRSSGESVLKEKMHLAVLIANQAASAVYRARLSCRLEESQLQTVLALAKVMESRDAYIGGHSRKVTEMAVRLAKKMNCSPAEIQTIRWAALLHDIGKVGIRDGILRKTGSLNKKEWQQMRRHPESGAEIVRMAPNMDFVASIILAHHERYDGTGYPYGLQRDMIPFGARILAVADAFSAITDDRPYRLSSTAEEAIQEIIRCSGTQFDPRVVDAFIALFPEKQEQTGK
jgi:putative nucleotidyltransferase with HDIG domain